MSFNTYQDQHAERRSERNTFRLSMKATEPVYLLCSIDNLEIDPVVDELSAGGARLICSKHFDRLYEGQILGPAMLVIREIGTPVVYPVVKWKSRPAIGVEFVNLSEKDQEKIFRFLFDQERNMLQPQKPGGERKPLGIEGRTFIH